jgi:hypothetical protein
VGESVSWHRLNQGGVVGAFSVTRHMTIAGFHLRFTEEGEAAQGCTGGTGVEGLDFAEGGKPKSGTIKFAPGASVPIIHAGGAWDVAVDTGTLGGGSLQPAEVSLLSPNGSFPGQIAVTLAIRKGARSGYIGWSDDECAVAFVVKPG